MWANSVEVDIDTWLGYGIPRYIDDTNQTCSNFKSLGNNCQFGGIAVGGDFWLRLSNNLAGGIGMAYVPVSAGSVQITDQQLLNLSHSLFPITLEARYSLGPFFLGLGAGYAIPLETPKFFPSTPISYTPSPLIPLNTLIGLDITISPSASFLLVGRLYSFVATKTGSTFHEIVPSIAIRARLF
jgi:hypothetical protein